jgi:putative hemolysin
MIGDLLYDTQFVFLRLPDYLRLRKISIVRPHREFSFVSGHYEVKIANETDELLNVLRLRFDVFYREFASRRVRFPILPYDVDHFDLWCDHLIVKDTRNNQVIAAYRLLPSGVKKESFYSEGEFDVSLLLGLEGEKLELGRACVHAGYRQGAVMSLLWKGLLKYARMTNTRYLFGCSSIQRKDFTSFHHIMRTLEKRSALLPENTVIPQKKYSTKKYSTVHSELMDTSGVSSLGSLMHMYIMAGARLGRVGAYDHDMDCLDLFTWIDLKEMPETFEKRFSC